MTDLSTSLTRLKAFRQSWNEGDIICEDSKLTVEDLDAVIEAARKGADVVAIRQIDLGNLKSIDDLP